MHRKHYIRLLILVLVASTSMILFSYTRSRNTEQEEQNCEIGKPGCTKAHSEFILWESLTRNLLIVKR